MLVCALAVEERAARRAGARATRVGVGAAASPPDGRLVSFGLSGALVDGLLPGTILTATRVVDERGCPLWEGEPLRVAGALPAAICGATRIVDHPAERAALAERAGALAVDMESGALALTGRLVGAVRAVSDAPARPLGRLAYGARANGDVAWDVVVRSLLAEPRASIRSARAARKAVASLERAAAALAAL